eukprot:scaffold106521_cov20-Tisochrysis_lutea.AAC.1
MPGTHEVWRQCCQDAGLEPIEFWLSFDPSQSNSLEKKEDGRWQCRQVSCNQGLWGKGTVLQAHKALCTGVYRLCAAS